MPPPASATGPKSQARRFTTAERWIEAKWGPPLTLSSRPSSSAPDPGPSGVESLRREPGWNGSDPVGQASG